MQLSVYNHGDLLYICTMYKFFGWIVLMFFALTVRSQGEGSAFLTTGQGASTVFATDYQALGINPANLAIDWDTKTILSIAEGSFSLYSDALLRSDLRSAFFSGINLSELQAELFSQDFIENGQALDINLMAIGAAFNLGKDQGFAFNVRADLSANLKLNDFGSSLIFQGFDFENYFDTLIVLFGDTSGVASTPEKLSLLFDGTNLSYSATAEINIGYGFKLAEGKDYKVLAGIGARYIMGVGFFDFRVEDKELKGFSSLSPGFLFNLDSLNTPSLIGGEKFKPVGHGAGFDLGVTINDGKMRYAASITDIGFIRWTGNVVEFNDGLIDSLTFSGIDGLNIFSELDEFIQEQLLLTTGVEARTSALPTQFRASIGALISDQVNVGGEIIVPLNKQPGNITFPLVSAGVDWCFAGPFHVSSGFAFGGNYDFRVPMGFNVRTPNWDFGFASRDVTTLFGKKKPTLSLAVGFLRFKFGDA
ncbi:MAG: hypothetical protein ACI959_000097 [Limisphaerales bacterium]